MLAPGFFLGALAAGWWACGRLSCGRKRAVRGLLLLLALAGVPLVARAAAGLKDRGAWLCGLCGQVERQDSFAGLVVGRSPWGDPEERQAIDAYVAWIEPQLGAHEHEWMLVGCHFSGSTVSCTMLYPLTGWCRYLPGAGDQQLAQRAVRACLEASPAQRTDWMWGAPEADRAAFERWLAKTF